MQTVDPNKYLELYEPVSRLNGPMAISSFRAAGEAKSEQRDSAEKWPCGERLK
jgi:hypothetical protein